MEKSTYKYFKRTDKMNDQELDEYMDYLHEEAEKSRRNAIEADAIFWESQKEVDKMLARQKGWWFCGVKIW